MVLRVSPELAEDLLTLQQRLFDETREDYSFAAIIRGLIALGLASTTAMTTVAAAFKGTRIARGRKRGTVRSWIGRGDRE
jgi:hypothetical protein